MTPVFSFSRLSPAPCLKFVAGLFEMPALQVSSVNPVLGVEINANVLLPVVHVDLVSDKPKVAPPVISDVPVDVVNVSDGLVAGDHEPDNAVLKERLIPKVYLLVFVNSRASDCFAVLGNMIGMIHPAKLSRVGAVAKAAFKFTRYRLQFHIASILFPQVMSNYG